MKTLDDFMDCMNRKVHLKLSVSDVMSIQIALHLLIGDEPTTKELRRHLGLKELELNHIDAELTDKLESTINEMTDILFSVIKGEL